MLRSKNGRQYEGYDNFFPNDTPIIIYKYITLCPVEASVICIYKKKFNSGGQQVHQY